MVIELKKSIDAGKVFFGIKQNMKNINKIEKVFLTMDAREEVVKIFEDKAIDFEFLDIPKEEAAEKLELGFFCEVFGVRKK